MRLARAASSSLGANDAGWEMDRTRWEYFLTGAQSAGVVSLLKV